MRTCRFVLFFLVFLMWGSRSVQAQDLFTWNEVVQEARRNNPDLIVAIQSLAQSQYQYRMSWNGFFPQISAEAGFSQSDSEKGSLLNDYSAGLSARQNIFSGFKDRAAVQKALASISIAESEVKTVQASLAYDLKIGFARLLFAQEQFILTQSILERRKANVRLVELRYAAGREHKGSYLRSHAAFHQAEFEVNSTKRSILVARRFILKAMGRSEFDVFIVTGNFSVSSGIISSQFFDLAKHTPNYLKAQAELALALSNLILTKGSFYPEFFATGSLSRNGDSGFPLQDRWSMGLNISVPLFTGGKNFFDLKSSYSFLRRAQVQLKSEFNRSVFNLEDGCAAYEDALEKTEVQKEFLESAKVRAEIARSQYTSGLLSFDDWDLIENDLINQQKLWLVSLRDAWIAEAYWEKVQGKGV